MPKIVVIIPCLNEEKTVGKVIDKIRSLNKKYFIIGIDDNSEDNSYNILKKKADKVIKLNKRSSLAEIFRIGLEEALKHNPKYIVNIDADNQYDAGEIPKLIKPILNEKADLVLGSRDIWNLKHMKFHKKVGNTLFSKLVSLMTFSKIKDAQTGFRARTAEVAKNINLSGNYTYTQEEIIRAKRNGFHIVQIPVKFKKRKYGRSRLITSSINYGIKVLWDLMRF